MCYNYRKNYFLLKKNMLFAHKHDTFFMFVKKQNTEVHMNNKLISIAAVAAITAGTFSTIAFAETKTPKIIVDERELCFDDQAPVIMEETGRTLIPLRFVLESAGAKIQWNDETKTVFVDSSDNRNRAVLTIGSSEMKMYYYPSVKESVEDTQQLDQPPIIMNDRTMIPVRAVLEAIGAVVDWDESESVINITSRAYSRYLRDMGVENVSVTYPLSNGKVSFDTPKYRESEESYDAKTDLISLSVSADKTEAAIGETINIYANLSNLEKIAPDSLLTTMTLTLKYDSSKLDFEGYTPEKEGTEYATVMDATNAAFLNDSLKIVSILNLGLDEDITPTKDGAFAKISFKVLSDEPTEISLSTRRHPSFGLDNAISLKSDEVNTSYAEANELFIDTTPIVINSK